MCGIVGCLGHEDVLGVLLNGLHRLEYRGYDSAGVAVYVKGSEMLNIVKRNGKVARLEKECKKAFASKPVIDTGIAHTRWATHGEPSDINSHPHTSSDKDIAIVHNGIVENYQSLKASLSAIGYSFETQTDTEVLAVLIGHVKSLGPGMSLAQAIGLALTQVRGAYGILAIERSNPHVMVGVRNGSPLLMGSSTDSLVLASDATALVGVVDKVTYLDDGDIVTCIYHPSSKNCTFSIANVSLLLTSHASPVEPDFLRGYLGKDLSNTARHGEDDGSAQTGIESHVTNQLNVSLRSKMDQTGEAVSVSVLRDMHALTASIESVEKSGYEHFMLKEIMEQPKVLKDCMRGRINAKTGEISFGGILPFVDRLLQARRFIICACGTSWHSGLVAEYLIESMARVPVEVEYASEFRYRNPVLYDSDIVIVISQSGETADTLEAVNIARQAGALVLGVVNVVGSTIARKGDAGIYLHVGAEIGVASTKAFTGQVLALAMLAIFLGEKSGRLSAAKAREYGIDLLNVPSLIEKYLCKNQIEIVKDISKRYKDSRNFLYLGRGYNFPVALEGALKLKEISYIHAEGYPAAEMKHGPIALIDEMMPVVFIAPQNDSKYEKVRSGIEEVAARKGAVIVITDSEESANDLKHLARHVIVTPLTKEFLYPLIAVVPLQLISYYIASYRGCDVDQPRNLAKSVTVE